MTNSQSVRELLTSKVDTQIAGFKRRQRKCAAWNNALSIAQMVGAATAIALVALNIKLSNTYVSLAAVVSSLTSALAGQLLQYFKFQERLHIAVATISRLHSLRARIDFDLAASSEFPSEIQLQSENYTAYFEAFESILNDANQAWSGQLRATIADRAQGTAGVSVQNIQS